MKDEERARAVLYDALLKISTRLGVTFGEATRWVGSICKDVEDDAHVRAITTRPTPPARPDGNLCRDCGGMTVPTGACSTCSVCGSTGGCG